MRRATDEASTFRPSLASDPVTRSSGSRTSAKSPSTTGSKGAGSKGGRTRSRQRTQAVWAIFGLAMVTAGAALVLAGSGVDGLNVAANLTDLGRNPIAPQADVVPGRWKAIIIHHSGLPAGSPESIERQHRAWGYASLGYHFVIGNGFDYGNGAVYAGPRWRLQQPGAHVVERPLGTEPTADWFNENAIGICLVGNGEKRGFTDAQIRELKDLIVELQGTCGIPDSAVFLHSDLAEVASPGRFFPVASVESWLRD